MELGALLRLAESMDITESGLVNSISGGVKDGALHLKIEGERERMWS